MGENVIKSDSKEDIKYKMYSSLWLIKKHTKKNTKTKTKQRCNQGLCVFSLFEGKLIIKITKSVSSTKFAHVN